MSRIIKVWGFDIKLCENLGTKLTCDICSYRGDDILHPFCTHIRNPRNIYESFYNVCRNDLKAHEYPETGTLDNFHFPFDTNREPSSENLTMKESIQEYCKNYCLIECQMNCPLYKFKNNEEEHNCWES